MPAAPETGKEFLERLKKPLRFALRQGAEKLGRLKDLEASLAAILHQAPATFPEQTKFTELLAGLDQLPPEPRLERIRRLLALIEPETEPAPAKTHRPAPPPPAPTQPEIPLQYLKGVGPWVAEKLSHRGVRSAEDLLFHLPHRYEDRRDMAAISALRPGQRATVMGEIAVAGVSRARSRRARTFEMLVDDGTGVVIAKWFQYRGDWLEKRFQPGQKVILSGIARLFDASLEIHHPDLEPIEPGEDPAEFARLIPVYPTTEGLHQKTIRRAVENALDYLADQVPDGIPQPLLAKRKLLPLAEALRAVHLPPQDSDLEALNAHASAAHRRLIYDEFFFLEVGLALQRRGIIEEPAVPIAGPGRLIERFRAELPFTLTPAQERVTGEILADLRRPHPMHRLLQGDVGAGKTVVAVVAALAAIEEGLQVAIMAPTEILAEQHFLTMHRRLESLGVGVVLLTSAVKGAAREQTLARIVSGDVQLIVGTHAVIQEKVEFQRLGLGIVDEQHRFGVMQRAKLRSKAIHDATPHVLVMTATPIPRTLAMTAYGDLDLSVIEQKPPGRRPILTKVYNEKRRDEVYAKLREQVAEGRQAFVVYPLVEESEKLELLDATRMAEHLQNDIFPDLRVGLLHGRMKAAEKEAIMQQMADGRLQILVATTVIEVGIDLPNATVMLVEHAERFGLSQLHQLRGRIGRGAHRSYCLLLAQYTRSDEAWQRLKVMEQTEDGFRIAEEDLALRGPGELLGTRQSGDPDFRVASLVRDVKVLAEAREDGFALVREDPDLARPEHRLLKKILLERWGKRLRLARVG